MTISGMRSALLRVCLLASVSIAAFAQTEPIIVQAEDPTAILGTTMAVGSDGTATMQSCRTDVRPGGRTSRWTTLPLMS